MNLTERHIINKNDKEWRQIDYISFLSKNLYNSTLYYLKKEFEKSGKFVRFNDLDKEFRNVHQDDYYALPTNTSQQIMMLVDKNISLYFKLLSKYKKDKKSLNGCPHFPKYKDKLNGRNIIIFTYNQAKLKDGYIKFPKKTEIESIKTKVDKLKQVRIIPQSSCYIIEIIYEKQEKETKSNNNYLSIDLGLNNLMTCFDTKNKKSFIINGKPLKSTNQYYNKKKTNIQSNLIKNHHKYSSNRLNSLTLKRNNKVNDYLHKSSRFIVNYCIENDISNIMVGYNKEWKQEINLGKRNNQNFVSIPYHKLIYMLEYKSALEGINLIQNEESYTSKSSALDLESLEKHEKYIGKRIKRGLFITSEGIKINADLNGSLNILRKVAPDKGQEIVQSLRCRGQAIWPLKINL